MEGYIDEYGQARVNIAVIGRKMEITVSPVIDTGFDGDMSLPLPMAIQLGLELLGSVGKRASRWVNKTRSGLFWFS